jgi:hypothetical protein
VDEEEDPLLVARRCSDVGGEVERSTRTRKRSVHANTMDTVRRRGGECHTRFPKKTKYISYVCQNHKFTHMIDK